MIKKKSTTKAPATIEATYNCTNKKEILLYPSDFHMKTRKSGLTVT